jgi:hypothetical protein
MDKVVESLLAAMALLIVTFVALGAMTGIWLWPALGVSLVVLIGALVLHVAHRR